MHCRKLIILFSSFSLQVCWNIFNNKQSKINGEFCEFECEFEWLSKQNKKLKTTPSFQIQSIMILISRFRPHISFKLKPMKLQTAMIINEHQRTWIKKFKPPSQAYLGRDLLGSNFLYPQSIIINWHWQQFWCLLICNLFQYRVLTNECCDIFCIVFHDTHIYFVNKQFRL